MLPVGEPADVTDAALRHPGELGPGDLVPTGGRGGPATHTHSALAGGGGQAAVTCRIIFLILLKYF